MSFMQSVRMVQGKEEVIEMELLVRTTLELEQYECGNCKRLYYINVMDMKEDDLILCPYGCAQNPFDGAGNHIRTLKTEVKEVWDSKNEDTEIYIKELKKPDDIIEVHKTLENLFGE